MRGVYFRHWTLQVPIPNLIEVCITCGQGDKDEHRLPCVHGWSLGSVRVSAFASPDDAGVERTRSQTRLDRQTGKENRRASAKRASSKWNLYMLWLTCYSGQWLMTITEVSINFAAQGIHVPLQHCTTGLETNIHFCCNVFWQPYMQLLRTTWNELTVLQCWLKLH